MNIGDITVTPANRDEERLAAYRLRYDVFSLECGDWRYANKSLETFCDKLDHPKSHLIVAKTLAQQVVGTLRLDFRKEQPFIQDELFDYLLLAQLTGRTMEQLIQTTGLLSRGVVSKEYRGKHIFAAMVRFAGEVFSDYGIDLVLTSIKDDNAGAAGGLRGAGFKTYAQSKSTNGTTFQELYLLLDKKRA